MKIIKKTIRTISENEFAAGKNALVNCMGLRNGERLLVVTDPQLYEESAAIFFEVGKKLTDKVDLIVVEGRTEHGQEPEEAVIKMMEKADVAMLVTFFSLTHTKARERATQIGTRIASLPTITRDIILRTLTVDYREVADLSKKVADILTRAKKVKISSSNGTDLELKVNGRKAIADTGIFKTKGDFGNLPAGEAFLAPLENQGNGVAVFDGCFGDIALDTPITVRIKNGKAVEISGGQAARILNERLAKVGSLGYNVAELGIGTNKKTRLSGSLVEVEKVYGTCHIALGNNIHFGGEIDVPFHSDGVILQPKVTVDGKVILKEGKLLI